MILFDPMTNTPQQYVQLRSTSLTSTIILLMCHRTSGLGDHGVKGLHDFIAAHECGSTCRSMKLASRDVLKATLNAAVDDSEPEHNGDDGA